MNEDTNMESTSSLIAEVVDSPVNRMELVRPEVLPCGKSPMRGLEIDYAVWPNPFGQWVEVTQRLVTGLSAQNVDPEDKAE